VGLPFALVRRKWGWGNMVSWRWEIENPFKKASKVKKKGNQQFI